MSPYERRGNWKIPTIVFAVLYAATVALRNLPLFALMLIAMPLFAMRCLPLRDLGWGSVVTKLLFFVAAMLSEIMLPPPLKPASFAWALGCVGMFILPDSALQGYRMGLYWALVCFVATVTLMVSLIVRYQVYGDFFEGLSHDLLRVMLTTGSPQQVLASAYTAGLASLDARRALALESLSFLSGGSITPWITGDIYQQLSWSFRATLELMLPSVLPDLIVKGTILFSAAMLYLWGKTPDGVDVPQLSQWYLPTPLGRAVGILLLLSVVQFFSENVTVTMAAAMAGGVAFWLFVLQGMAAYSYTLQQAHASDGQRRIIMVIFLLILPIIPAFSGVMDQLKDPRGLREDMQHGSDDFPDF